MKFAVDSAGLPDKYFDFAQMCGTMHDDGFAQVVPSLESADPGEFRKTAETCEAYGLETVLCRLERNVLTANAEEAGRLAEKYGISGIIVSFPERADVCSLQETALNLMRAADTLHAYSTELIVDTAPTALQTKIGNLSALEYLIEQCHGKAGILADVTMLTEAGEDPYLYLKDHAGMVKAVRFSQASTDAEKDCFVFARMYGLPKLVSGADVQTCLQDLKKLGQYRGQTASFLNILDTESGEVKVLHRFEGVIEAPNWLKKENVLLFNSGGRIYRYSIDTDTCERLDTGVCTSCNNDHVVSPDETMLGVSHMDTSGAFRSLIYVLPLEGGEARLVTENSPSFLHGWSPDGNELAYCAFRIQETGMETDICTIDVNGGTEKRLTPGGFNDGPEYSPDGQHIWFNSTRSGLMQVWRMNRDGSDQSMMSHEDANCWFPHVSPDGKKVVYLVYRKGDLEPAEHLPGLFVRLCLMNADGSENRILLEFFGGQGSINVNSWSKDSRHLAFVSYELL